MEGQQKAVAIPITTAEEEELAAVESEVVRVGGNPQAPVEAKAAAALAARTVRNRILMAHGYEADAPSFTNWSSDLGRPITLFVVPRPPAAPRADS